MPLIQWWDCFLGMYERWVYGNNNKILIINQIFMIKLIPFAWTHTYMDLHWLEYRTICLVIEDHHTHQRCSWSKLQEYGEEKLKEEGRRVSEKWFDASLGTIGHGQPSSFPLSHGMSQETPPQSCQKTNKWCVLVSLLFSSLSPSIYPSPPPSSFTDCLPASRVHSTNPKIFSIIPHLYFHFLYIELRIRCHLEIFFFFF